jgi:trimeric autotransporter adhesin
MKNKLIFILLITFCFLGKAQIISTVAGDTSAWYWGDGGPAIHALLNQPMGVTIDAGGNLYIADYSNNVIRKVNTSGIITTVVGNGYGAGNNIGGHTGDGGLATNAEMWWPSEVIFDSFGNMYVADQENSRIRKVSSSGIITTVAGIGPAGSGSYTGDGGQASAAGLFIPNDVVFDAIGNMYIADACNCVIRKVNAFGIISTIAGVGFNSTTCLYAGGYSGDGGLATYAKLNDPMSITFDSKGNLYIADIQNMCIRKIDTFGIISTVVGNGTKGFSGDGGPATSAQLNYPVKVVFDAADNLFIADCLNNRIRKVDTSGIISTVVGNGFGVSIDSGGYAGDGGLAINAELFWPHGMAFDASGNLYIGDSRNNCVRKVAGIAVGINSLRENTQLSIYPNPANETINISSSKSIDEIKMTNMLGTEIIHKKFEVKSGTADIDISNLQNGIYFISIISGKERTTKKLIVSH